MKTVGLVFFIILLYLIAVMCLLYTDTVKDIAVKSVSQGLTHNSSIETFIRSSRYTYVIKAVGFGAILMACFLIFVFFRNTH